LDDADTEPDNMAFSVRCAALTVLFMAIIVANEATP
jgi:hypothetical protein